MFGFVDIAAVFVVSTTTAERERNYTSVPVNSVEQELVIGVESNPPPWGEIIHVDGIEFHSSTTDDPRHLRRYLAQHAHHPRTRDESLPVVGIPVLARAPSVEDGPRGLAQQRPAPVRGVRPRGSARLVDVSGRVEGAVPLVEAGRRERRGGGWWDGVVVVGGGGGVGEVVREAGQLDVLDEGHPPGPRGLTFGVRVIGACLCRHSRVIKICGFYGTT